MKEQKRDNIRQKVHLRMLSCKMARCANCAIIPHETISLEFTLREDFVFRARNSTSIPGHFRSREYQGSFEGFVVQVAELVTALNPIVSTENTQGHKGSYRHPGMTRVNDGPLTTYM